MAKHRTHLCWWSGCAMTRRMGIMLVDHLDRDQNRPTTIKEQFTTARLVQRCWLRVTIDGQTTLTDRGRQAAHKAAAALADDLASPSIVPVAPALKKERV